MLYMGAQLVGEVWGRTYEDAVTSVTAKLDNVLPDDLRQEVARAEQSLVVGELARLDYRPWELTIHTLRQCIGERRRVRLLYRSLSRQEDTERDLDPYALTFQWGLWYLVGYCHLREDLRTFRVDRIQAATPLEDRFTIPRDFSLQDYLARTMRYEPQYSVAVRVEAGVAPQVRERHGDWMHFSEEPDGSLIARFDVVNLDWVTGWVLGFGAAAVVLEPPELIARLRETAEGALGRYRDIPSAKD